MLGNSLKFPLVGMVVVLALEETTQRGQTIFKLLPQGVLEDYPPL